MGTTAGVPTTKIDAWLRESGLVREDMRVRQLDASSRNALNLPPNFGADDACVIPYYSIGGSPLGFYRARVLGGDGPAKYIQPKGSLNHVYYPPNFRQTLVAFMEERYNKGLTPYVIMTEGEKKAALSCKLKVPAVAFGGV